MLYCRLFKVIYRCCFCSYSHGRQQRDPCHRGYNNTWYYYVHGREPGAGPSSHLRNRAVPEVVAGIRLYLLVVSISYGMQGIFLLSSAAFNALNKPLNAALLSLVRMFALYIPIALLGNYFLDLKGLFGGAAAANVVTGVLAVLWIRYGLKNPLDLSY